MILKKYFRWFWKLLHNEAKSSDVIQSCYGSFVQGICSGLSGHFGKDGKNRRNQIQRSKSGKQNLTKNDCRKEKNRAG
jgi:hypothetical protein